MLVVWAWGEGFGRLCGSIIPPGCGSRSILASPFLLALGLALSGLRLRAAGPRRPRGCPRGCPWGRPWGRVAEHDLKVSSCPGHPTLDRTDGAAADRRRLLIFEAIRAHQDQGLALLRG